MILTSYDDEALFAAGGTTRLLLTVSECVVEIGPAPRPAAPELDLSLEEHGSMMR